MLRRFCCSVVFAGIATAAAGCNAGGSSPGPASALTPGARAFAAAQARLHPYRRWAASDIARTSSLLFITDLLAAEVKIYALPSLTLKGQVGGFNRPYGECADASGNVWIVDDSAKELTKLSHTGEVVAQLQDTHGIPWSCAVDPATGNLAVTNEYGNSEMGNVAIYAGGSGLGTGITNPQQYFYWFDGYDSSGNLWVDGEDAYGDFMLSSCSASSCSTIPTSDGTIYSGGFVQWAAGEKTWYVADDDCGHAYPEAFCIYPVSSSGVLGTSIVLKDRRGHVVCSMFQGVIAAGKSRLLFGGDLNGSYHCGGGNSIDRWSFPTGGDASLGSSHITFPYGAAISIK